MYFTFPDQIRYPEDLKVKLKGVSGVRGHCVVELERAREEEVKGARSEPTCAAAVRRVGQQVSVKLQHQQLLKRKRRISHVSDDEDLRMTGEQEKKMKPH